MDALEQLEKWRKGPKDDGEEVEPTVDNRKAIALAAQLEQLAMYDVDKEKEERRSKTTVKDE